MFIVGVIVGPVLGVELGYLLANSSRWRGWMRAVGVAVLALLIAVIPVGALELRLGLALGIILGALLWLTPPEFRTAANGEYDLSQQQRGHAG